MHVELDRFLLGDNPFFGVDHLSHERARQKLLGLDARMIQRVIERALLSGAEGITFSPHPTMYNILGAMREQGYDRPFGLYPLLPNAREYSTIISEKGIIGLINHVLASLSWRGRAKAIVQGGLSGLTADPVRGMKLYLDIELEKLLRLVPSKAVVRTMLLHEIVTDLCVSLRENELLPQYVEHMRDDHHMKAGFVTRNFVRFVNYLEECNLSVDDVIIMTPFNKLGFQMTPSREACEASLSRLADANVIAISILAAGQLRLHDAIQYFKTLSNSARANIKSLAVGVSTESHAQETFTKLRTLFLC